MYSPKIKEALIPLIYRVAKREGVPMTHWVNRVLKQALSTCGTDARENTEGSVPRRNQKRQREETPNDC
jgi:hypothetical protein